VNDEGSTGSHGRAEAIEATEEPPAEAPAEDGRGRGPRPPPSELGRGRGGCCFSFGRTLDCGFWSGRRGGGSTPSGIG